MMKIFFIIWAIVFFGIFGGSTILYIISILKLGNKKIFALQNGICSKRFNCKNLSQDICNLVPKNKENFVECDYYLP